MGRLGLALVALAGCAAEQATVAPAAADRAGQVGACAAAVAEHEGVAVDRVSATWESATAEGTAIVAVRSPEALHTCEVDDALRVREILHPGA